MSPGRRGGELPPATVVLYEPGTDAGVPRLDGLDAPAVAFAGSNSVGLLLTTDGQAHGMAFARSATHPGTGWALTADEPRALAAQGARADAPIQTRDISA